ncbi:hypothetical protein Xoosp13_173 [Xanthomonas phage Xoo-sp13]|nr:hypothetical protein Xoosp13_173 [Xanthomonas phage Xoo-sp13]
MAYNFQNFLTPTVTFDDIPQLENDTPVLGGPSGPSNAQAQTLLNRTEYLQLNKLHTYNSVAQMMQDTSALDNTYAMVLDPLVPENNHVYKFILNNWTLVADRLDAVLDNLLESNGSASIGYIRQPNTNTVNRTVAEKFGELISVLDYGAIGDGIANDTAAIQKAITDNGAGTIYFPAGTYLIDGNIALKSNQSYIGDGMYNTVLTLAQSNISNPSGINGLTSVGDLNNVTISHIGIKGNVTVQTTVDNTGQSLFGLSLRGGSVVNFTMEWCRVFNWGGQQLAAGRTGGGIIIGPNTGSNESISNIRIINNVIEDNGNAPGVYVGGVSTYVTSMVSIDVSDNIFTNSLPYASQNMIYVLGDTSLSADRLTVVGNQFNITEAIDAAIEINYANNVTILENVLVASSNGACTPILIRANCFNVNISDNVLDNVSTTTNISSDAIVLLNFVNGEIQTNVNISNNIIRNFGRNGIMVSNRSSNVMVAHNIIQGVGNRMEAAILVASSNNIVVKDNLISRCSNALQITSGDFPASRVDFLHNKLTDVGGTGKYIIDSPVLNVNVVFFVAMENTVYSIAAGTTGFISTPYAASTGNRVINNNLPVGLTLFNPSYKQYIERWVKMSASNGTLISASTYSFMQGPIEMIAYSPTINWSDPDAQKSSYTFGANLDGQLPDVEVGDTVFVSPTGDFTGMNYSAFVKDTNQVRIQITNVTSAALTMPAGNWYVTVIKRIV